LPSVFVKTQKAKKRIAQLNGTFIVGAACSEINWNS